MNNLEITAHLNTPIATFNKWTPAIDGILIYLLLERERLLYPNPTQEQVEEAYTVLNDLMPLGKGVIGDDWYWQTSSPIFAQETSYRDRYRKRWDYQENNLNWGKRKAKWQTSEGGEKSYDLPLECNATKAVRWYGVGYPCEIKDLLQCCTHIGKKRSYGNGEVNQWEVKIIPEDWHLVKGNKLMRPIPKRLAIAAGLPTTDTVMNWGWKPPSWLHTNQEICLMP